MTSGLLWNNLVAYSMQIGLLIGLAAAVPVVLRLKLPGARLIFWRLLLAACLLLPAVRPWRQDTFAATVEVSSTITAVAPSIPVSHRSLPRSEWILLLLAGGAAIRLAWLAAGFWKLRHYRRHSTALKPAPAWSVEASLLVCGEIASPVTFGFFRPVVLLPDRFPELSGAMQDAILCHEVLHVRRRDWLSIVGEEIVRSLFWFHPAIWWLLGEIGLAREQEVDRLAVEMTRSREEYLDALLEFAGAHPHLELVPAPLFLRKRHLKQRVILIAKEVRMSKTRFISTLAAGLGILFAACWMVTATFPLVAAPQMMSDAPGVTVDVGGAALLHRTPVAYPAAALRGGEQGTVAIEVKLDAAGNVSDARVLSGPDGLRKPVLESVLQWHFAREAGGRILQVNVAFQQPSQLTPPVAAKGQERAAELQPQPVTANQMTTAELRDRALPRPAQALSGVVKNIQVSGLSSQGRDELLARLPLREGDSLTPEKFDSIVQSVREFDEHLTVSTHSVKSGEFVLVIRPNNVVPQLAMDSAATLPTSGIKVGQDVQAAKLISHPAPEYPALAKQARISGLVMLAAIIAKDGTVQELKALGGHPLLIQAALDAVKQWVYQPTLLNGAPVEVATTISVTFSLAD